MERAQIGDIEHVVVDYDRNRYAGHPRQHGIARFADGELAALYSRAPCAYAVSTDVQHGFKEGYKSRSQVVLRRSQDGGRTWPAAAETVVYDESRPLDARRAFLAQGPPPADGADLADPDAMIFFGRTATGPDDVYHGHRLACFAIRSADRGRTWEDAPAVLAPPPGMQWLHRDNHPLVSMPDGSFVGAVTAMDAEGGSSIWLYGSENDGVSWDCLSLVARDETGIGRTTYPNLVALPDGRLQCYMLMLAGRFHTLCMCESRDCFSWSKPAPIVRYGHGPWARRWAAGAWTNVLYRSPWPLRLRDGRIVVLYARRQYPAGIAAIVSADDGASWSDPAVIRDDAGGPDIGYPTAVELDDGQVLTVYYFQTEDGNGCGGTRFIAASRFRLA